MSGKPVEQLPREVVDAPYLEIFRIGQDSEPPDLIEGVPAHCRGLDQVTFKDLF